MIICKTPREIEIMREAGKIVALTHKEIQKHIQPGITTKELDTIADKIIRKYHLENVFELEEELEEFDLKDNEYLKQKFTSDMDKLIKDLK